MTFTLTPVRCCHVCGCTETNACAGGCWWIGPDLCSACGRDSRQNPAHGDRVTVGTETREVERVNGDQVIYSWPGVVAVRTLRLAAWRAWAANATGWTSEPNKGAAA
ncbi:hypothetical protein [Dyella lutea]|uniref:Uncharacterized protein n=1 Tax=Dyella lutea TaxID=2950441 RepID=A0ABT1FGW3_9GAMM|nr:hypothetical protein [Dyella lutea]MCP1375363.1 hypothetical protein [Dyella lutea]